MVAKKKTKMKAKSSAATKKKVAVKEVKEEVKKVDAVKEPVKEEVKVEEKKPAKKTTAKKATTKKTAAKKTAAKKTTKKAAAKKEEKKPEVVKKPFQEYKDVINWKKWEAHNMNWLYIEINAKDLLTELEAGVDNMDTCCNAILDCMLEGDYFVVEPKNETKIADELTVRYYCDNLSESRRKWSEVNHF